ncbi:MAG: hypothetical protein Q9180_008364 [Flavoplaca navasiana]
MLESVLQHEDDRKRRESVGTEMQDVFEQCSRALPQARNVPHPAAKPNLVVLLTGSTGSVGSYILDVLISDPNVSKVYCLTHGDDGEARQTVSFKDKGLKPVFSKVIFCPCDFTNPLLGLDAYQSLQEEVTHIIHNAWDVNLYRPLSAFITPHISGVRYLIDFCAGSSCNPQLMFVSTQSTSLGLPMMADGPTPETSSSWWNSAQDMGYAQSKLIAERILDAAAKISGIRSVICRVGQVAGPTDPHGIWNLKEWFPSIIATATHLGKLPSELGTMNSVDWIPVNLVAKILVELLFTAEDSGDSIKRKLSTEDMANTISPQLAKSGDTSELTINHSSHL